MSCVSLATPGTEGCDAVGGAFRLQWREWPPPFFLSLEVRTVAVLLLTISRRGVFFLLILRRNASMAEKPSDLVQGTLDMLILKTLALEPMHGYGIAVRLEQMSEGVFRLQVRCLSPFSGCNERGSSEANGKPPRIADAQSITS